MTSHRFDCTMCGRCCHDLKLPMSIGEAMAWLTRGGTVNILTEAFVCPGGDDRDPRKEYGWHRSVAAISGQVPVRIGVTLVGVFEGACPYLLPDRRCGGYEDRPGVCRIYPAEINPLATIDPALKSCPSEAWAPTNAIFVVDDVPIDPETRRLIEQARTAGVDDIPAKAQACVLLGIADAAFANEGFAIHAPEPAMLLAVLRQATENPSGARVPEWRIVTNRSSTHEMLCAADADGAMVADGKPCGYHGFFPAEFDVRGAFGMKFQARPGPLQRISAER